MVKGMVSCSLASSETSEAYLGSSSKLSLPFSSALPLKLAWPAFGRPLSDFDVPSCEAEEAPLKSCGTLAPLFHCPDDIPDFLVDSSPDPEPSFARDDDSAPLERRWEALEPWLRIEPPSPLLLLPKVTFPPSSRPGF